MAGFLIFSKVFSQMLDLLIFILSHPLLKMFEVMNLSEICSVYNLRGNVCLIGSVRILILFSELIIITIFIELYNKIFVIFLLSEIYIKVFFTE